MVVSKGSSRRAGSYGLAFAAVFFSLLASAFLTARVRAQEPVRAQENDPDRDAATERERAVAERFLEVLKRRPRPGTALDRVYGFHVQNGSLEEFIETLNVPDNEDGAGQQQMILGLLQSQRGKESLAATAFERAEKLLPEDAATSYYLGRSHLAVGQTEKAAAAMERAIDRKPMRNEALPIFTELGRIYGRAGQSEKALAVWTRLESMFPGDAKVGGQIARTFAEEGNVEEALKRYQSLAKSARKDDERIAFSVQAAEMLRRLGKADEATKALEAILAKLRPGSWLHSDVRNRIEEGFLRSGDFDALASYYQSKLAESEDDLTLQVRLGRVLVSAGRLDDARATLEKAVLSAPEDTDLRLALIDVLVSKAEMKEAGKQYEKLAEQDPENPDYLLRWGQILLDDQETELQARRDAASEIWKRLAKARAKDAVTLSQIADRMRSIDLTDDAIALYQQAIDVDPKSPQYREYLGEYQHQLGRKDDAIATWESIAEGDRRDRESLVRLAEVFGAFEQPARSIDAWREASKLDLTFGQELRFAKILRDAKSYDEALERLDIAEKIAETPDENEQLLRDRITTYQQAGTLTEKIAELKKQPESVDNFRQLALMHSAASQLTEASTAIKAALDQEPDNVDLLIVSAEIAERQSLFMDAAKQFLRLADVQVRYRTNYLQRAADLHMRLGQVDRAMEVCDDLIETNPARVDSYQFLAGLAFRAGRDDQAITALRKAMSVAPRDNSARQMLAESFASRYRTEEAIELYWQAMRYERETGERISLVKKLAPLYDRKSDVDTLVRRIEDMGREDGDTRSTQLMLAAAHEAVRDFGEARQAIDRLLAQQPRDVKLLETMVRLSDAADEVELAAEFQGKIVNLADTPENRLKLVQLQLDAETIDIASALSQRISLASDPTRLRAMIKSATSRGDIETAIVICKEALKHDASLWDVKMFWAELLLYDKSDSAEKSKQQAFALLDEVIASDVKPDAKPPTLKVTKRKSSSRSQTTSSSSPQYWSSNRYTLLRAYRLGRYASRSYSYGYQTNTLIYPNDFAHAQVLAEQLKMVGIAKGKVGEELKKTMAEYRKTKLTLPPLDEITDPNLIWQYRALRSTQTDLLSGKGGKQSVKLSDTTWRLAELDPKNGASGLASMLMNHAREAIVADRKAAESKDTEKKKPKASVKDDEEEEERPPLTTKQLDLVVDLYERAKAKLKASKSKSPVGLWQYETVLPFEFKRSGLPDRAKEFPYTPLPEDSSFSTITSAISFHLRLADKESADALVPRLLSSARSDNSTSNSYGSTGMIRNSGLSDKDFLKRHRIALLDAFMARSIKSRVTNSRRRSTSLTDGTVSAYVLTPQGYYTSLQLKAPLSGSLMSQEIVSDLASMCPSANKGSGNTRKTLEVPDELIQHLETPLENAPAYETKARRVLAAYAHWWGERPEECYEALIKLCNDYADDVDLQIERARLASELKQPRVALDALDSFDPLDSKMLVRKEMAAMNLASRIGDVDRAKQSAERLFGMRMDTSTQLALADQLRRLGMNDQASAVMQRLRGGRSRDVSTELEIANAFLSSKDDGAAAEVAYTVLRKLNSGRSSVSGNEDYYRRRAVSILQSARKLEPLIQRAERRLKSTPSSNRARVELADLYTAAGRADDAEKLWQDKAAKKTKDPRQMLSRAKSLSRAKKYKESALLYLDAFEKEPRLFSNNYYEMTRAVTQAKIADEMFKRLCRFDPSAIPYYRVDELLRIGGSDKYSDAKRKFVLHAIQNEQLGYNFNSILRSIPTAERKKMPEIDAMVMDSICSPEAFAVNSSIWSINSYSSNGTGLGGLEDSLKMLTRKKQGRTRFAKAAEKAKKDDATLPTARFLLALVDLQAGENKDDAVGVIRELVGRDDNDAGKEEKSDDDESGHQFSHGLLWQAGQIIEKIDGIKDRNDLVIDIYKTAMLDPNHAQQGNLQYTVVWRLIKALGKSGKKAEAREFLVDAYESTDHSADNQYNPGYGDYQDLTTYHSLATSLKDAGCPFDALVICNRAIAEPEKFEKAKRWGGGRSLEDFEQLAKATSETLTPATATDHLKFLSEKLQAINPAGNDETASKDQKSSKDLMEDTTKPLIRLLDLPVSLVGGEHKCSLQMAIGLATESDKGKEQIAKLDSVAAKVLKQRPADWSIHATRLMLAIATESDQISKLSDQLISSLPKLNDDAAENETSIVKLTSLKNLVTPLVLASESESPDAQQVQKQLVDYLGKVAIAVKDPQMQVAIAKLGGAADSLESFLSMLESGMKTGAPPNKSQADSCLDVAKSAAQAGDVELSARALTLALGHGPPMRELSPATDDAFAISRNTNSRSQRDNQAESEMQSLSAKVLEIIDLYSDATGERLGVREPKKDDERKAADEASMKAIASALKSIVLPEGRENVAFLYQSPIVSTQGYDNSPFGSGDNIDVRSASVALARAAVLAKQSDELMDSVIRRQEKLPKNDEIAMLRTQIALAMMDSDALSQAVAKFEEAVDDDLPEAGPIKARERLRSISSELQQTSYAKSATINNILGALWPLSESDSDVVDQATRGRVSNLLSRTASLIASDSYTAQRHRNMGSLLNKRLIKAARDNGNEKQLEQLIAVEIDGIRQQYSGYSNAEDQEKYTRQAIVSRLSQYSKDGLIKPIALQLREQILSEKRQDFLTIAQAVLCLNIAKHEPEEQYEFLTALALGSKADDPIVHWGGAVRYSNPPELVARQTPRLAEIQALPVCTDELQISDTMLLLADVAAQLGRSEDLATLLSQRSKEPGDKAGISAALVRLAAVTKGDKESAVAAIDPTLRAIAERLEKDKPSKNDKKLVFPALELYLVARSIDAGVHKQRVEASLRNCSTFAARGNFRALQGKISKVFTRLGIGRNRKGVEGSPLKHFDAFSLPKRYGPDVASDAPLYSIMPNGALSGSSGQNLSVFMLRYPIVGEFSFSANIHCGNRGEADVSYQGVNYPPIGWTSKAKITAFGSGSTGVEFPVEGFNKQKPNVEEVRVSDKETLGVCNDKVYVTDRTTRAFPFVAITQMQSQITEISDITLSGKPVIPDHVDMIDPTMRGWFTMSYGGLPDRLFPIGPKQDAKKIKKSRQDKQKEIDEEKLEGRWYVKDKELKLKAVSDTSRRYDADSLIQYARPLQDGESVEMSFWWEKGKTEAHPTIGRTALILSDKGTTPNWVASGTDLVNNGYVSTEKLDPPIKPLATDNTPKNKAWNTITMTRKGDSIAVQLNEKAITEIAIGETSRPGILRKAKRSVRIQSVKLTGDWPTEVPADLLERN